MAVTPYRTLIYQRRPPVVVITLARPDECNRVNLDLAMELHQVCQQLRQEEDSYVAILTGSGACFSMGRDPLLLKQYGDQAPLEILGMHRASAAISGVSMPIIAALNGDAFDQGLELALACDLRIAARGVRMGFTDLSRGVIPWDGGTQRLPRLVGAARALEMLLTGRVVDAEEACRMGLVNMVSDPESLVDRVEEVSMAIAAGGPIAARYTKEAVLKGMELTLEQGLRLEADLDFLLQSTADRAEGIQSFREKREPKYRGA